MVLLIRAWIVVAIAGCSGDTIVSDETGSTSTGKTGDVLEVTLEGNISLETPEMTVDIYETAAADPVPVQVLIVGGRGPDNWQAMFGLDLSMITTGAEVEVEVLQGPLAVGNGTVRKFPSNPEVDNYESILASAGTIRVALETSRPMVTGTVQVEPKDLSAVLRGRFQVRCFKAGADATSFALDDSFSSPFCQQFAAWKP